MFSLSRGALPGTRFAGGGAVTWPHDTVLFDFQVDSPEASLDDLRWVSPDFPSMSGRGVLVARSETGSLTAYDLRDLHLREGNQRVDGELVVLTDRKRGLGVRDMRLSVRDLDLDVARPYIDSLPFYGRLTGSLSGAGYLDAMDVSLDWAFADARVPGNPISVVAGDGVVGASPDSGLTFSGFKVRRSNVDLRTVRLVAPAVILEGRLEAVGTLDGPLRNVFFDGTARHQDGDRPVSQATGAVHLDTRFDTLSLATDVTFDPLSFEGIRRAFPSLASRGDLRGTFRSRGTLSRLEVDAALAGELGNIDAIGAVTLQPPRWGADGLELRFSRLDLGALSGRALPTDLTGRLEVTGSIDTLRAPEADLTLTLGRGRVREWEIDSAYGKGAVHDSVIRVDTAYVGWKGARASGGGTLGWRSPYTGEMAFSLIADSLIGFDSLLLATTGQARDTSKDARPLGGTALGNARLAGSLDSLQVAGELEVQRFEWQRLRSPKITGTFGWLGGKRPQVTATVLTDSISAGTFAFRRVSAQAAGYADSLAWSGGTALGVASRFDGAGEWYRRDAGRFLTLDSLQAVLAVHRYRLAQPVTIALADSAPAVGALALIAVDGSGHLRTEGRVPGTAPGDLAVDVQGLDLQDLYGLLQRDTLGVAGDVGLTLQVGGTAADPTLRGIARLSDGRFGDFLAPLVQGVVNYESRRLDANLDLWRTGEDILQVEAHLPLDLAFQGVPKRRLDGPLSVRAHADSVDLGLLEALTPAVAEVQGILAADVQVDGTWAAPRLAGHVEVRDGSMSVPGLGVRFGTVKGVAALQGDSVVLRDVLLTSGGGRLSATGGLRLEDLSRPVLGLDLRADQFRAIDVRNFLTLVASGNLHLTGPVFGATLTGNLVANSGVLYFADLVNKRIINLEDPTNADLVDTSLIRRANLGAEFQNRFLDSLRVDDRGSPWGGMSCSGPPRPISSWRAAPREQGGREYRPIGTLTAARGSYTLKIGPVTRDFTVSRGRSAVHRRPERGARHPASHIVRTVRSGEEIPVMARITGTLFVPKVALESPSGRRSRRPTWSRTSSSGAPRARRRRSGQGGAPDGPPNCSSALSSEVERALIQDFGVPIDLIEIRPGVASSAADGG